MVPRIPGVDEYIAALDEVVIAATSGKTQPEPALQKAANDWDRITDAHGRDKQAKAYLKHLGIDAP